MGKVSLVTHRPIYRGISSQCMHVAYSKLEIMDTRVKCEGVLPKLVQLSVIQCMCSLQLWISYSCGREQLFELLFGLRCTYIHSVCSRSRLLRASLSMYTCACVDNCLMLLYKTIRKWSSSLHKVIFCNGNTTAIYVLQSMSTYVVSTMKKLNKTGQLSA